MSEAIIMKNTMENMSLKTNLRYSKTNYEDGKTITNDAHIHSVCEIYMNISGDISFLVENTLYPVESGDIILTMPNEMHHCVYNSDGIHEHCCMWFSADGDFGNMLDLFEKRNKGEGNLISMNEEDKNKGKKLFMYLCERFENNSLKSVSDMADLFTLFSLICNYSPESPAKTALPDTFKNILQYIDSSLSSKCIGEDIASKFYISRSTLYRMFKTHLNMTPAKYIEAKRLSLAKTMLENKKNLQEVCTACGFNDYSHFIAIFKKKFGITPHKYVKKQILDLKD